MPNGLVERFRAAAAKVEPTVPPEVVLRIVDSATGETMFCSDPDFQPREDDVTIRLSPHGVTDVKPLLEALGVPVAVEGVRQEADEDPVLRARRRLGL